MRIFVNFQEKSQKNAIFAIFAIFTIFAIFASSEMFRKHGNYQNISKIWKTAISETCKNENFGKKCLSQGLTGNPVFQEFFSCLT